LIKLKQAVVVEGKYDKIKLSSIIDAVIIETNGYRIFKDREKLELIRYYAMKTGIIIMTDSDSAGFKIRNFIKGAVTEGNIINVYIPDIFGKEKRKEKPSCEGKIGVEGMNKVIIFRSLEQAGVMNCEETESCDKISKTDLFELGLSGRMNSSEMRRTLLKKLELPQLLSASSMLDVLNTMMNKAELEELMMTIDKDCERG
jgi:ribonuclease M5